MFNLMSEYPVSALFYGLLVAAVIVPFTMYVVGTAIDKYRMNHFHGTKSHCAEYYRLHYEYEMKH